jgi:STE24 endopeptidase
MTAFDPVAATAAHMSAMSPAALAKAIAYTHAKEWMLLWAWLAGLVNAFIVIRLGLLTGVRNWLEKNGPRPWLTSILVGLTYLVASWVLGVPWAIYADWWFEKSHGMSDQSLQSWFQDGLIGAAFSIVIGTVFLALLYLFLRIAKRSWWLWAGLMSAVMFLFVSLIAPVTIEPALNHYKPAPPGAVRDAVVELGRKTGTPTDKIFIYDGSKQSNRYTANVSGLGGTARVAMSDVMFKKGADLAEVRGVVGHEMGHYVHQHVLWGAGAVTILALVMFWLTDKLFPMFKGLFGADKVKGIADPAGAPVLFAVLGTLMLIATPIQNSLTRIAETDADNFSLKYANEPDGLSKALVKTADYRAPWPSKWEEIIFYDHPSVGWRVRNAMDWKAKHPPADTPSK